MDHRHLDSARFRSTPSFSRRAALRALAGAAALTAAGRRRGFASTQAATVTPVTSHPRLWLTADDLPRLRSWATDANPIWRDGLLPLAATLTDNMDAGHVPAEDAGSNAWELYPSDNYALFFAFMSLVHPDEAARADYARRARKLLMHVITEAAKGVADRQPFRDPEYSTYDRSRWWGDAYPLTVDWIYPSLSDDDKALVRGVFLRWLEENVHAETTTANHPEPVGPVNDPALTADPILLRWAGNNYFDSHMRNIGLMAMAFDLADDPGGKLGGYLEGATGAWLYMVDALLRGDARGGLPAEGFEYNPQALAYVVEFLLALHTAGRDDPETYGPQVVLRNNPFWDEVIPAYLHSLSPATALVPDYEYMGPVYLPDWYGDGQIYWTSDFIGLFGALGRFDDLTGNAKRLETLRWLQTHTAPGGAEQLIPQRVAGADEFHNPIFYFLLFDPAAKPPADPHADLPLVHFAPGLGRLHARTSWEPDATWFTYALGWNTVDHQHCDGNQFEFYRKGEWLTKERTGYGYNIACSDYHNTLALENDKPDHYEPDDYRANLWERGSQWALQPSGDPTITGPSSGDGYIYATGDATNLYNSSYEYATDILHASRSLVWLSPDHIVVYDRAASKTDGRFKRFWLNMPANATVNGNVATMTTANGQQLAVTTLLPADAAITAEPAEPLAEDGEPAVGEPMRFRLRVEAPGGPKTVRFLHVLQGTDAGASPDPVTFIESSNGAPYAGVAVGEQAVLFPVELGGNVETLSYTAPAAAKRHLIGGLTPDAAYDAEIQTTGGGVIVTILPGAKLTADGAGLLVVTPV